MFHNNTASLNDLFYESHASVLKMVAMELGSADKIPELMEKILGPKLKIKAPKDPNKPKRAKTSYLYFCEEMRPGVKNKHPELKMGGIMKELGKMWQELPEDKKEKYNKLYEDDKLRYEEEMEEYE